MIETLTIITLSVLFLIFFRPGKTRPLQSPLVVSRNGQYHAVLAPMLNLAQPLLADISGHLGKQDRASGNTAPRYYKVTDKEVKAHGKRYYLLAVTLRDGELYFQATSPRRENDFDVIHTFSEALLARHPSDAAYSGEAEIALAKAVETAAGERNIEIEPLTQ